MSLPPHRVDYSPIIDRPRLTYGAECGAGMDWLAYTASPRGRGVWAAHGRTIIEWYRQHQPAWSN